MKRLLLPLLAALALPTAVNANVDPKVAEMCMKAADFKGCVETMSGRKDKKQNEKQALLDKSRFLGIASGANCMLNIDRLTSDQAQYFVVKQLKKDGLEYLMDWGREPQVVQSILRLSKAHPSDCNPNKMNWDKFNKVFDEEMTKLEKVK